jgi:hypothetical protein
MSDADADADIDAAHRELNRLATRMAASGVGVLAARDQITDQDDLKMLEWISVSITSLQDLAAQSDAALLLDRPHRHAIRNCLNAIKGSALLLIEGAPGNGIDPSGDAAREAEALVTHCDEILSCLDEVRQGVGQG